MEKKPAMFAFLAKGIFAGLIFLMLSGQALADEALIEAAKKEQQLVYYTGMPITDAKVLLSSFEKKYPFIKTTHYRAGGPALISRIQNEYRAGRHLWDVFSQPGLDGYLLLEQGFLAKYDSPERKYFREGHKDSEGFWTTLYTTPNIASYNRKLVSTKELPRDYFDLLDPKWKGKLGLDSREVEWYANIKQVLGAGKSRKLFEGLRTQDIGVRQGRSLLTELLGAGEFYILVNNYLQNVIDAKEKGSPVEFFVMDPVILAAGPIAINKAAPHPNAARLFVDYCLSKEGQALLVKLRRSSARMDIEGNPIDQIKNARLISSDIKLGKTYVESFKEYQELLGIVKK
jgi:ABC-type Fe3+ transport system substrate-binding protein